MSLAFAIFPSHHRGGWGGAVNEAGWESRMGPIGARPQRSGAGPAKRDTEDGGTGVGMLRDLPRVGSWPRVRVGRWRAAVEAAAAVPLPARWLGVSVAVQVGLGCCWRLWQQWWQSSCPLAVLWVARRRSLCFARREATWPLRRSWPLRAASRAPSAGLPLSQARQCSRFHKPPILLRYYQLALLPWLLDLHPSGARCHP